MLTISRGHVKGGLWRLCGYDNMALALVATCPIVVFLIGALSHVIGVYCVSYRGCLYPFVIDDIFVASLARVA
jgi:hypothetical protein